MAKRLQEKPRKQRSLRGMARHGLSILMAMIMVISLIQISVFADSQYEIGAQITLDSDDSSKLPTNIPDNAYWDGPEVTPAYITGEPICGKEEHTHITETSCAHLPHTDACYEDVWVPCTPEANPDHYDDIFGNPVHKLGQGDYDWQKVDFGTWKEELVCSHQCSAEAGCVTKDMLCEDPCPVVEHTHNTDPNDSEGCCYEVVSAKYTWTLTEKGTMDNGMVVTGADVDVEEYHFLNSALAEMKAKAEADDPRLTQKGVTFTELKVEFKDGYKVNAGPIIGMWRATVEGITDRHQPENISGVTLYYYNWLKVQRYSYTFTPDQLRAILYEAPCGQLLDFAEVFLKDATSPSTYYTVTFDYGYKFDGENSTSYEYVKKGETVAEITPTRSGYKFDGWYLDGVKYDFNTPVTDDITLTAQWTESTDPNPDPQGEVTNFYISLDGTVWDYVDADGDKVVTGRDTSNFSGSVGTGEMTETNLSYTLVGKTDEAASTNAAIRALATLKDIPNDADVFAALQKDEKMQAYCTANEMDISTITSENYNIYWYVVKYENDGWHVDGVLVAKGEEPNYPVEYTVVHEYYTDGEETYKTSQTLSGYVGDEVKAADLEKKLTDDQGNTYTYASASADSITLVETAQDNVITLRYERTTDDGNHGGTTRYTLTVKYLVEGTNEELAEAYSTRIASGRSYDVTDKTKVAIEGYIISDVVGEAQGTMKGDVEIIVYYVADLDDGETPLDPGPGGNGDGDGTDIGDGEVPLDPGTGNSGDGTDIGDENVPLVPATGDSLTLWVLAAVASAAGLVYLVVTGKKREQENG